MIAGCYRDIKEYRDSCDYCRKANEYKKKAGIMELNCDNTYGDLFEGCSKVETNTGGDSNSIGAKPNTGSTTETPGGGQGSGDSGTRDSGSETPSNTSGSTSGSGTGGLPILPIAITGLILLVLAGLILFVLKRRNQDKV